LTGYDDTTGFVGGMHTDDTKNVVDSQGRVLVNVNHPPDEMDIFLTPKLGRTVKCHQV
jgi:RAD54-like protein 2